jgi:hypothetical protein
MPFSLPLISELLHLLIYPLPLSFGNDSEAAADLWERYLNVDFDGRTIEFTA